MYVNQICILPEHYILATSHTQTHILSHTHTHTNVTELMYVCMSRICVQCFAHARKRDNMTGQPQCENAERASHSTLCMNACVCVCVCIFVGKAKEFSQFMLILAFIFLCYIFIATLANKQKKSNMHICTYKRKCC